MLTSVKMKCKGILEPIVLDSNKLECTIWNLANLQLLVRGLFGYQQLLSLPFVLV
jgi:hypothetical protein